MGGNNPLLGIKKAHVRAYGFLGFLGGMYTFCERADLLERIKNTFSLRDLVDRKSEGP